MLSNPMLMLRTPPVPSLTGKGALGKPALSSRQVSGLTATLGSPPAKQRVVLTGPGSRLAAWACAQAPFEG